MVLVFVTIRFSHWNTFSFCDKTLSLLDYSSQNFKHMEIMWVFFIFRLYFCSGEADRDPSAVHQLKLNFARFIHKMIKSFPRKLNYF
jgi:hypothetical protein